MKSKISDLIRVNEQTEFSRDMFSINLKTLPVTDQKQSGRCWIFAGCNVIREKIAKKYLHKYTHRVIIMQNYSKSIHGHHPHPTHSGGWKTNLESRRIYEREENNYEAKGIH